MSLVVKQLSKPMSVDLMQYTHSYLGFATERTAADSMGYACASASMDQGEFNVEAVANMLVSMMKTTWY